MINMRLSEAAQALDATCQGTDVDFRGCSTDTRTLCSGELFIALRGQRFDGHQFVPHARQRGARAAMVEYLEGDRLPAVVVNDTRVAMGRLAGTWRMRFDIPVIAVTGSNGKTTVKEMLNSILSLKAPVLATQGNLNNEIGVPLTLFDLDDSHHFAVIEMGANHAGEIAWLSQTGRPTVALITHCGPTHLEGFGDIEGVARAKGEVFQGLPEDGVAVINADDAYAGLWCKMAAPRRCLTFASNGSADVKAGLIDRSPEQSRFVLKSGSGTVDITLSLPGKHNVMNALAATACALAVGIDLELIKRGLESMRPVCGRLQSKRGPHGSRLLDDSYNANPASLQAALDVLADFEGKRWLVLGDMGELGSAAANLHESVGSLARKAGVERMYAIGDLSRLAAKTFGKGAHHYEKADQLITALAAGLHEDVTVLIKGSRSMHMEQVVASLAEGN